MNIRFLFALTAASLSACTSLGPANKSVPAFTISPPPEAPIQSKIVKKGEILIQQSVTPFKTAMLDSSVSAYGNQTLPSGLAMFAAASPEGTIYCTGKDKNDPAEQYRDFRGTFYCFRDDNQDGKFDRHFAIGGPVSAFPTFDTHRSPWIETDGIEYSEFKNADYPAKFLTGLELDKIEASKNSVRIRQFVKLVDSTKLPTYLGVRKKLDIGQDGIVSVAGAQMRIAFIDESSIRLEILNPLPAKPFAIGYTPGKTFYVP